MASVAANRGALPAITDVREAPTSLTARVKKICETPGASSPARAKTASSFELTGSPPPALERNCDNRHERGDDRARHGADIRLWMPLQCCPQGDGHRAERHRRRQGEKDRVHYWASEAWRSTPEG